MDAHQAVTPIMQRVVRIAPHPARPQLRRAQRGIVFQPGNCPLRTPMHLGEAGVNRRVAYLPVDAAHRDVLGQHLVKHRPVLLRSQHPAACREAKWCPDFRAGRDGAGQIVHGRFDFLFFDARPRPALGRPKPVIVKWVSLGCAVKDAFIELVDDRWVSGILALGLQPFLDRFRDDERSLGADARLYAHLMREAESVP